MPDNLLDHQSDIEITGDPEESPQTVPVNAYETTEALVVVAPLPGVTSEDVDIWLEGRNLTISAAMRTDAPKDYVIHEWHYGPYRRSLTIPEGFGSDATVSFGNGQIALSLARGVSPSQRTQLYP